MNLLPVFCSATAIVSVTFQSSKFLSLSITPVENKLLTSFKKRADSFPRLTSGKAPSTSKSRHIVEQKGQVQAFSPEQAGAKWSCDSSDHLSRKLVSGPLLAVTLSLARANLVLSAWRRIAGKVSAVQWSDPDQQEQACSWLQAVMDGVCAAEDCLPILMQGAAAEWTAREKWTWDWLEQHHGKRMCKVRVAGSLQFTYTDTGLLKYYAFFKGKRRAPSVLVDMSLSEFLERSQPGCQLSSLVYPQGSERYYLQSALTADLRKDIDLRQRPFSIAADAGFGNRIGPTASQMARMWISPAGAVSPLHFDASSSFLIQLQGRKRMLFWPPRDLPGLYPYHNLHLLRRRARVDPTAPDYKRYPRFRDTAAYEAIIEPGDVMFFPSCWAHYTESLDDSISVTCRFGATEYHESVRPGLLW